MSFVFSMDLLLFFCLLALFVYLIVTVTITKVHKVYLFFHLCIMQWPMLQYLIKIVEVRKLQEEFIKSSFIDLILVTIGWLSFTMILTGYSRLRLNKKSLLFILPALISIMVVILNPSELFVSAAHHENDRRTYGPLFWLVISVLFIYLALSIQLLLQALQSDLSAHKKKAAGNVLKGITVLILFAAADILCNVIMAKRIPIVPGLTSFGILLSNIIFVISIHRDKVLDILTIAHQDIIDTLGQGILVLDENDFIVEINKVLRPHFQLNVGDRFRMEFLKSDGFESEHIEPFLEQYRYNPAYKCEIEFVYDVRMKRYLTIHAFPILINGAMSGRIITFQDVSESYRLIQTTKEQNRQLRVQNESLTGIKDQLSKTNEKLEQMAFMDSLTGCYNRHYLTHHLELEIMRNRNQSIPFSLILLDIDYFKSVNDRYGHLVGDEVICSTVDVIRQTARETDIVARYGGEELLIYLPHTNLSAASAWAERLRAIIEANEMVIDGVERSLFITVSMGVCSVEHFSYSIVNPAVYLKELLSATDEALYQAKQGGRNRVISEAAAAI